MLIPRFWAEARRQHRDAGRQVTVRRFGWSVDSQEAAEAMAQARADDALQRIVAGESLPRRDRKVPYNGADGLPIREEVVGEEGRAVLTRNAYGAVCLNVPDVLIADVDFDARQDSNRWWVLAFLAFGALGTWFGGCAGGLGAVVVLGLLLWLIDIARSRMHRASAPEAALRRAKAFCDGHREWSLRAYRTPAGLRLIATHRTFDPIADGEVIREFFEAVQADDHYARMCWTQQCFRARLTPKPWRIGIKDRMRPRPGTWPVAPERLPLRRAWVERYEQACEAYAACRFITGLGAERIDPQVRSVVQLHDRYCRALEDLPIA